MKNKGSHFIDKWPEWKKEMLDKYDSEDHVELACDSVFDFINHAISNPTMPTVRVPKFGTLRPMVGKLNMGIKSTFRWWKKGNKTREDVVYIVKKLWPVRNRLINEFYGEFTATNWHQYFRASVDEEFIDFVKNKYIIPRKKMPYDYKIRENKKIDLN